MAVEESKNIPENIPIEIDDIQCEEDNFQDKVSSIIYPDIRRKKKSISYYRPYASPTNRIVMKCGKYNIIKENIPEKTSRYFRDLGNTILSIRWRWILISICLANGIAYLIFTFIWMAMVLWEESYMDLKTEGPCINGTGSFAGYLILVVDTMTTIGTGSITPTDCQNGWIMMTLLALTSVAIEGALVSAVFVKMSRPNTKDCIRQFSKKAVICIRDGDYCVIFRVKDLNGKYWARTSIKAVLIRRKNLKEGDSLPYYFENLKLENTGLLIWPQEVVHRIDKNSPFWKMSKLDMSVLRSVYRFEVMIILEGDSLTTGHPSQSQTSYTNKEILWGHRFSPCVEYDELEQKYIVNKKMFNETVKYEIPECSARELYLAARNESAIARSEDR
ncbi:Inward rectifier potassium channel C-terminal domain [Popillia japonica]|uniref:Inward rectifier potassium channel C-terminal domain n=1 Tax=Popillia japonica TaxID=7064 RepID=A0AAW1IYY5_POPJA